MYTKVNAGVSRFLQCWFQIFLSPIGPWKQRRITWSSGPTCLSVEKTSAGGAPTTSAVAAKHQGCCKFERCKKEMFTVKNFLIWFGVAKCGAHPTTPRCFCESSRGIYHNRSRKILFFWGGGNRDNTCLSLKKCPKKILARFRPWLTLRCTGPLLYWVTSWNVIGWCNNIALQLYHCYDISNGDLKGIVENGR